MEEGEYVKYKEQADIKNIAHILMQLDEKSLLLIDSGAKLLAARQNMDMPFKSDSVQTCRQMELSELIDGK